MDALRVSPLARELLRRLKVNMSVRTFDWQAARELIRKGYADTACGWLLLTREGRAAAKALNT